ncbi:hypothetical protein ACM5QZ_12890, partial [Enterococcus faecalis]
VTTMPIKIAPRTFVTTKIVVKTNPITAKIMAGLSKNEKIIVHLAGLITNYLTINFIQVINLLFLKNKILDSSFIFFHMRCYGI